MTNNPIFEHRHFTWLAHYCRKANLRYYDVAALADELASTNPRFDRQRFMTAATTDKPCNWRDEARNNVVP